MEAAFATGMRGSAPYQEYLLQGSIMDQHLEVLLHRLRGLCDNTEATPITFHDHEMVFMIKATTSQPTQPVLFRVRKALDHQDAAWHIRYLGPSDGSDKSGNTTVRACYDVACSDNVVNFLQDMGFILDHEFVVKGYFFHKGRMKVTVSKIHRVIQPKNTESLEPLTQSHLVELSVVAATSHEQIGEDMKNFAEQLKPLVQLDKTDTRKL